MIMSGKVMDLFVFFFLFLELMYIGVFRFVIF